MPKEDTPPRSPSPLPSRPFVGLEPCDNPATFGGRSREIAHLTAILQGPCWLLCVHAPPGAGKTSLLQAGVIPAILAASGPAPRAVLLDPWPARPGLQQRIQSVLHEPVAGDGSAPPVHSPSLLVLDHLESLVTQADGLQALSRLLVATLPTHDEPLPCQWVWVYDDAVHSQVQAWIAAFLARHRAGLPPAWRRSPPIQRWRMPLLGEPAPHEDPAQTAQAAFQSAIVQAFGPSDVKSALRLWSLEASDTGPLAERFAELRLRHPSQPLTCRLQLVLDALGAQAHREGGGRLALRLPDDSTASARILRGDSATYLRRRLDEAFYREPPATQRLRRTLACILLAELVTPRTTPRWLPVPHLRAMLGAEGKDLLDRLSRDRVRLILRQEHPPPACYHLPHSELAGLLRGVMVDGTGRQALDLDGDLLNAWQVLLQASNQQDPHAGPHLQHRQIHLLQQNLDALPMDPARRSWWESNTAHRARRTSKVRWMFGSGLAAGLGVALGIWGWMAFRMHHQQEQELVDTVVGEIQLLGEIERGQSSLALLAMLHLHQEYDYPGLTLLQILNRRPADERDALLANGWEDLSRAQRNEALLPILSLLHPYVWGEGWEQDESLFGALLTALNQGASDLDGYATVREQMLRSLRSRRPPPDLDRSDTQMWSPVIQGVFTIGCQAAEAAVWRCSDEVQPHPVELSPFRMHRTEVTVEEYQLFDDDKWPLADGQYPVKGVNWYEAAAYAAWMGGALPSEAQWEAAARAGSDTAFWSGNSEQDLAQVGWYAGNLQERPTRVARLNPPHPFGLFDIHGNLAEWCRDWYGAYNPAQRMDPVGPPRGEFRVARGGAWFFGPDNARSSSRLSFEPSYRSNFLGFRVVVPEE